MPVNIVVECKQFLISPNAQMIDTLYLCGHKSERQTVA